MPGPNLADLIARNAGFAPRKLALRCEGTQLSYGEFAALIEAAAFALADTGGVRRGDRVAYLGLNSPRLSVLLYACARLGAMLLPLNWRLARPELAYIIGNAEPKLLAIEQEFARNPGDLIAGAPTMSLIGLDGEIAGGLAFDELVAKASNRSVATEGRFEDPVLLVYTSGTTGHPKGALLTQACLHWNSVASVHMHGLTARDHVLTVLPMFHVGGLNIQTTPALHAGATVTLHRRFAPGPTLAAIAHDRPSLTVLVPATIQAMLADPGFAAADFSSLRAIAAGSTVVSEELVDTFAARGVRLIQVYGATETGPVSVYERFDQKRDRRDTTGLAGYCTQLRIVDDNGRAVPTGRPGEIALRGPGIFAGYWRDEAATSAAFRHGWYLTGDIGKVDPDGYLYVHDRKKNVIISGGENIYPAEIERVIMEIEAIAECAVVGVPDARWQEVPVALVVPRQGATLVIAALEAHLAANLARFKLPRRILTRDSLPKNAMGKVQHFLLKAQLAASHGEPGKIEGRGEAGD